MACGYRRGVAVPEDKVFVKKDRVMYRKVGEYVRRYRMLDEGDRVIAGVSGGADSICLLFMLIELAREIGFSVVVVHVHHGLRGKAADEDADYVKKVCGEQGIGLRIFHEDVKGFARRYKMTVEEAGREIRRECFRRVLEEEAGTKIALAHHQNDNAETLLWNLCRGCGIKGLGGIAPVSGIWIRPLLCLKRNEIESYLENRGICYCTDGSNLEDDYTRNRIRRHVVPYLEEHVNGQAVLHMSEMMEQMRMIGGYIGQEVCRYSGECVRYEADGRALIEGSSFGRVPEALRALLLHETLCQVAGRRKDIEQIHVKMLEELFERQVGRQVHLPYGVRARRSYEGVEVFSLSKEKNMPPQRGQGQTDEKTLYDPETDIIISGESGTGSAAVPENTEWMVRWRVFEYKEDEIIFPEKTYTKWFDYDIIKNTVKIRHREQGDYITISDSGGTQKLKQYFINEKVPGGLRDRIWLAADGQHIMWIVGYRQNQKYQITGKTRRILEIEFYGGEDDGGKYQGISSGDRGRKAD